MTFLIFLYVAQLLRIFSEPVQAINEMFRVLKPCGKALIIDLRPDASIEEIETHIRKDMALTGINFLLTKWAFQSMLLKRAYPKVKISQFASQSKFTTCTIEEDGIGMYIYFEKQKID